MIEVDNMNNFEKKYNETMIISYGKLIYADDAKRAIEHYDPAFSYVIDNIPTVDAVEVVHGRWIPVIDEPTRLRRMAMLSGYRCSVCGRYEKEEQPYCNCGAKMDGDIYE